MSVRARYITLLIGLGSILSGYAQSNLVLNPSFEQYDSCTVWVGNTDVIHSWDKANQGTTDYFHSCNSFPVSQPTNAAGFQYPQHGEAYVGIYIADFIDYRESIQGVIQTPLEQDKYYCFEMYISIADTVYYAVDEIGVFFGPDTIIPTDFGSNNNSLPYQLGIDVSPILDTVNWHLVSGVYKAQGGEKHFVISYFSPNMGWTRFRPSAMDLHESYYYIDNVRLYECTPPAVIIPDVFTPNGDGINDTFYISYLPEGSVLKIYNRWGNIVYENGSYHNDWDGTCEGKKVSDGTYFYVLQTPDGKKFNGIVNIF